MEFPFAVTEAEDMLGLRRAAEDLNTKAMGQSDNFDGRVAIRNAHQQRSENLINRLGSYREMLGDEYQDASTHSMRTGGFMDSVLGQGYHDAEKLWEDQDPNPDSQKYLGDYSATSGVPALGGYINTGNAQLIPLGDRIG